MPSPRQLAALHKHWIAADSLDYHLRRSFRAPMDIPPGMNEGLARTSMQFSIFAALSIWYSLLYVVIEGYVEIHGTDAEVDKLLAQEEYISALRRFRNATFHYQEDMISNKLLQFLSASKSEIWIKDVNIALKSYLERELKIADIAAVLNKAFK